MLNNVEFEVLTTVVAEGSISWDITPCSPLKFNPHFEEIYQLCLQGRRISEARNRHETGSKQSFFDPVDGGDNFL
jgi:hypothetical protein